MFEILQYQFMLRALIAGIFVSVALALSGVFVVLRRSAFFGDAIAHFAFAGIAIGFLFAVNPIIAAMAVSLVLALGIGFIQNRTPVHSLDTLIGIFFSGAAALGIFAIGLLRGYRADLFQFLFGDIIAVSFQDVVVAAVITAAVVAMLAVAWKPFFKITFNRDIALVSGIRVSLYDYLFLAMLALITAISIKIVGIILVPALLVIPAATAKNISKSLHQMFLYSAVFSMISVVGGLVGSFYMNTASGASIVLISIAFFVVTLSMRNLTRAA